MPRYIIERELPSVGNLSPEELQGASQISNTVLAEMGPEIQWVHSYVTGDKIYCVYLAADEAAVKEHALRSGFPANQISEVATIIDPATAETPIAQVE